MQKDCLQSCVWLTHWDEEFGEVLVASEVDWQMMHREVITLHFASNLGVCKNSIHIVKPLAWIANIKEGQIRNMSINAIVCSVHSSRWIAIDREN